MLLSPTGHIRADFTVARDDDGWLLLQAPDQPDAVGALLAPYVLSADVTLTDIADHDLFAIPGAGTQREAGLDDDRAGTWLSPSVLGSGADVWIPRTRAAALRDALEAGGLRRAGAEDAEALRILRGSPRMGADFGPDALPAEVGLGSAIDLTKGCFLGQESVARVRNLGHPPWTLRHMRTAATLAAGDPVWDGDETAGVVTSAASDGAGTVAIVRVRWASAQAGLTGENGEALIGVGSSG